MTNSFSTHSLLKLCLLSVLLAPILGCAGPGINNRSSDFQDRDYIVYKPRSAGAHPPLMIMLHGGMGNAKVMRKTTNMDRVAAKNGFIVVYANGVGGIFRKNRRTWNAGDCCGRAVKTRSDDVGYIASIIDKMSEQYNIDTRRVYLSGFSNGAMMAYRVACEIPGRIAAIIPVSGTIAINNCDAGKDVPVFHIHGARDTNVPFSGGKGQRSIAGVAHKSVDDTLAIITRARNCTLPERFHLNKGVDGLRYFCRRGAPVRLYIVKQNGHVWPGGQGRNNKPADGRYISASDAAWAFAKKYAKK